MAISHDPPDNANVIAPAPVFYGLLSILGLAFNYFYPFSVLSKGYALTIGIILILISIPIAISAAYELRKAGTAFDARKTTTALVTDGIFRFSRNPTYLSLTMLFAGAALLLNSMPVLISVGIAAIVVHIGVIKREENYMAAKFGDSYFQYKKRVRPWF